ncbi:MAG: hypothetical protein ACREA2_10125 [Blastocatellia bacterium]
MQRVTLVAYLILSSIVIGAENNRQPTIPILTQFGYWDHHWFAWLPQHPVYEAVEIMLIDSPDAARKVIWVYFTERLGSKNQDHYLSDPELAKRWSGRPYYREIEYKILGEPGSPLGIHLGFQDKDNAPVDLDFKPVPGGALKAAGLTRSAGHAANSIFHLFYRDKDSLLGSSSLLIEGKFVKTAMPAYSSGIYPIIFSYGKARFDFKDSAIVNSWGRIFIEAPKPAGGRTYQGNTSRPGWDNVIEVVTDDQSATLQYRHRDRNHFFQISFDPALPNLSSLRDGQRIKYEISLDNKARLLDGTIEVFTSGGNTALKWLHENPDWAKESRFHSNIQLRSGEYPGYDLLVQRDQ